jgi:hypothetical protein
MSGGSAAKLMAAAVAAALLGACGEAHNGRSAAGAGPVPATWTAREQIHGVVDLAGGAGRASIVVAAAGRLWSLAPDGTRHPFAPAYSAPRGLEPYIAISPGLTVRRARCRFPAGEIYALRLTHGTGVTAIDAHGHVRRFARLPRRGLENGIAFDATGRFGHRLLVTATRSASTTLFAIDCRGHAVVLTSHAPKVEGGIVVAPATFGRFGGALIAPDELSGNLYAIGPNGRAVLVVASGIPHGQDIGVESEGFVPVSFGEALVADRGTKGNPHPGDDAVLGIGQAALRRAGVRAGDLLAVSEGGATTVAVTCRQSCRVRTVATGPARAHVEGHVVFEER